MRNMIHKLIDCLPVFGGVSGALSQAPKLIEYMPTLEAIISTIILTAVGAAVGYIVKILLDKVFYKKKK
jgi:hypothetical protein